MSLPALHAVRRAYPQAQIHLLLQKELIPLLEGHPDLDKLLPFEPREGMGWTGILRTALRLRGGRFDAVVVMNPSKLFHAAAFLAGIPLRIGYRRKLGFLLNRALQDTKASRNLHESQYNLELAGLLDIPFPEGTYSLPLRKGVEMERILGAHGISAGQTLIAMHPWTSNPEKSWPLDSFWQAARPLIREGYRLLLIGQPPQGTAPIAIPPEMANLAGKTPLSLLPSVLRRCSVLLSNDSGPVHVAAAVGTPVVVVAPREHARQLERWKPLGSNHRILIAPPVEEVVRAVRAALEAGRGA